MVTSISRPGRVVGIYLIATRLINQLAERVQGNRLTLEGVRG